MALHPLALAMLHLLLLEQYCRALETEGAHSKGRFLSDKMNAFGIKVFQAE